MSISSLATVPDCDTFSAGHIHFWMAHACNYYLFAFFIIKGVYSWKTIIVNILYNYIICRFPKRTLARFPPSSLSLSLSLWRIFSTHYIVWWVNKLPKTIEMYHGVYAALTRYCLRGDSLRVHTKSSIWSVGQPFTVSIIVSNLNVLILLRQLLSAFTTRRKQIRKIRGK